MTPLVVWLNEIASPSGLAGTETAQGSENMN